MESGESEEAVEDFMQGVGRSDKVDDSYLKEGYQQVYMWIDICQEKWREGMEPGVYITSTIPCVFG